MNTLFDDVSELKEGTKRDSDEESDSQCDEPESEVASSASLCHVAITPPQLLDGSPRISTDHLRSTISLLGGEVMARWGHFLKKICVDSSDSIFPVSSPAKKGQLLYRVKINGTPCYLTGSPGPVIAVSPQLGSRYTWGNLRWQPERALRCAICRAGGGLFTVIRYVVLSGRRTESRNYLLRVYE